MPLCPNCKTFYVEEPCPTCDVSSKKTSIIDEEDKEALSLKEEKSGNAKENDGLVDFFGNVGKDDEIDFLTGRRKKKEALVSTPWHMDREIRSINQRKAKKIAGDGEGIKETITESKETETSLPSRLSSGSPATLASSSTASSSGKRPIISSSIFNPITSSPVERPSSNRSRKDKRHFSDLKGVGNQQLESEAKQGDLASSPFFKATKRKELGKSAEKFSATTEDSNVETRSFQPASSPSLVERTNDRERKHPEQARVESPVSSSTIEPTIPKWLLVDKSKEKSLPAQPVTSRRGTAENGLTTEKTMVTDASRISSTKKTVSGSRKRRIMGFLKKKLLRRGKSTLITSDEDLQRVNLSATHVKAGGLTLPRWLVGEKVDETRSTGTPSSQSRVNVPTRIETEVSSQAEESHPPSRKKEMIASPRVIDETLLELEKEFKDHVPSLPFTPSREDLKGTLVTQENVDNSSAISPTIPSQDEETEKSIEMDDFEDFDLEELAAQVIAQLEAPDISETEHRLDPQALDTLEALAAEFLKETAGKEDVVRTEVVRRESATSLALDPEYSKELSEVPGFENSEDTLATTTSRNASPFSSRVDVEKRKFSDNLPIEKFSSSEDIPIQSSRASAAIPLRRTTPRPIKNSDSSREEKLSQQAALQQSPQVLDSDVPRGSYQRTTTRPTVAAMSPVDYTDRPVVISVEDLVKTYKLESGKEHRVLMGIQMQVYQGEWVAIVGPSGSGKSTLLNILGGLDNPTVGSVYILGQDITKMSDRELSQYRLKTVGFVFQFFNLVPELTAIENIEFPQRLLGVERHKARERAEELLDWIGLWDVKDQRVDLLSGGEQQRVAICVALANDPPIILMDEPTGNLDKANTELVMDIFERLNQDLGKTLVCVTHDLEVAARAHRVYSILNGKLVEGQTIVD